MSPTNLAGRNVNGLSADCLDRMASLHAVVFDFDGVFTDNTVSVDQNGVESVRCWRSDGLGLARLREHGLKVLILSTETNPVVAIRAEKMKTDCIHAASDKAASIKDWAASSDIALARVAFVGNDINDIPAFTLVGLPIAVADAYPEILPFVAFRTTKPGGYGAVREICDLIAQARSAASSGHHNG